MIGWGVVLVQETVMNLRQIFYASFWCKFLVQVSWACFAGISSFPSLLGHWSMSFLHHTWSLSTLLAPSAKFHLFKVLSECCSPLIFSGLPWLFTSLWHPVNDMTGPAGLSSGRRSVSPVNFSLLVLTMPCSCSIFDLLSSSSLVAPRNS